MNHIHSYLALLALATFLDCAGLTAAEWFAATNGTPAAPGTQVHPWDIASALNGRQKIQAGDTIWLRGGTYKFPPQTLSQGFPVKLAGREGLPIHVRAARGERATIDGGLSLEPPATHLWLWDLEILVSEPRPPGPVPPDPTYRNINRPWGGLNINTGAGCKFINLVIHDNAQGVSWWSGSQESELYGCIIYDNGWAATDRGHGHAIYTQNREGLKSIAECILTGGFGYSLHAYGSARAYVDHYLVAGNLAYHAGPFLIGGGRPSHDIQVLTNLFYRTSVQLGYNAPTNDDCTLRGNLFARAGLSVNKFARVIAEGNVKYPETNPPPAPVQVFLRPNKYTPGRAHIAIFNWSNAPAATLDLAGVLAPGQAYRLVDPRHFYGPPVQRGRYDARPLRIPLDAEFTALVLLPE